MFSDRTLSSHIVATIGHKYIFFQTMNKILNTALVNVACRHPLKHITHRLFGFCKHSESVSEYQRVQFSIKIRCYLYFSITLWSRYSLWRPIFIVILITSVVFYNTLFEKKSNMILTLTKYWPWQVYSNLDESWN